MRMSAPIEVWLAQYNVKQATPLLRLAVREMRARAKAAKRKRWGKVLRKRAKLRALLDAANSF